MRYNKLMEKYLNKSKKFDCNKSKLRELISPDFIEQDGAYLLKHFFRARALKKGNIEDLIGYECDVNQFHTQDYVEKNFLEEAFCFAKFTLNAWQQLHLDKIMTCIISIEFPMRDANIRFHLLRPNELQWLVDDLEEYKINGILQMYSNEDFK